MRLDRDKVHIDVTVQPCNIPEPKHATDIPEKLLKIMMKYKYNWRLDQLSKPRVISHKFTPPVDEQAKKLEELKGQRLSAEKKYYADHMSKPPLRFLYENQRLAHNKKLKKKIARNIKLAWKCKYNHYKKIERDRRLRQIQRELKHSPKKKREPDWKRYDVLCQPKKAFRPQAAGPKKPKKVFANYGHLDELAAPKARYEEPPKPAGVNPAALEYEPTEAILKLAEPAPRMRVKEKPVEPGAVKKSALRYKASPRIGEIALPKKRSDKASEEDDVDPWAIPKAALKYKATPRILELAKPLERD